MDTNILHIHLCNGKVDSYLKFTMKVEKPPLKLISYWKKYMAMNVHHVCEI